MVDVHERLRDLREAPAPDLWPDIEHRGPRPSAEGIPWGRIGVSLLALSVAIAGIGIALRSFYGGAPTSQPEPGSLQGPASNGVIAFNRSHEGGVDLWLAEANGSDPRNLTRTEKISESDPAWSPDGRRLAYVACLECTTSDIWIRGADGGDPTRVTNDPALDGAPAWSPDGARIAYHSGPDGDSAIYVIGADGTGRRRLSQPEGADISPAWSPDGSRIAFIRFVPGISSSLFVINSDGSREQKLTEPSVWVRQASWSPDGEQIALAIMDRDTTTNDLFVMDTDGSNLTRLTEGQGIGTVAWAPDGSRILFSDAGPRHGLATIRPDGTDLARIYTVPQGYIHGIAWQPILSGDGDGELDPRITATVEVGASPTAVALGEGAIWVVVQSPGPPKTEVVRIDPVTNQIAARIPVPHGTSDMAVGEGAVWVATYSRDEGVALVRIDPSTNQIVATVPGAGGSPTVGDGAVWAVVGRGPGDRSIPDQIVRIDPGSNQIVARIPIPIEPPPFDIEVGDGGVWVLHSGVRDEPDIARIDPATNIVTATVSLDTVGTYMATGGGHVWVWGWPSGLGPPASRYSASLRISEETASVVGEPIPVEDFRPFGAETGGVWFTTWRRFGEEKVCRLSFENLEVDACVGVPSFGETYADLAVLDPATRTIWVLNDGDTVTRIDLR